jgi:hypothetical protein
MYIADTCNNHVLRIAPQGITILGGPGSAAGQLRHPIGITRSADEVEDCIWVVDQRNHRVQNLGPEGEFLRSVGICGIGPGRLFLPESAVFLPDHSLVVAQAGVHRALKCFAVDGRELWGMTLDYAPGGMIIHRECLLVTEKDGSSIRIYEPV